MPDSRHIVVSMATTRQAGSQVWMADTQSDAFWPLASGLADEVQPAVSPDGRKVIFDDEHTDYDIEEAPLSGGPPQPLIATDRWEFDRDWPPAAQQFVYVTDRNGPQEIWLKSAREGWSRPLVTPDQFSDPTQGFWGPCSLRTARGLRTCGSAARMLSGLRRHLGQISAPGTFLTFQCRGLTSSDIQ